MPLSADPYVTRMNIQPRYESALPSTPPPSPPFPIAAPSFSTMSTSQLRTIVLLVSTVAAYLRPRSFETSPTLFFGPLFLDPRFPTLSLSLSLYWLVSTRSPVGSRKILSALITQTTRYLGLASSSSSSHTTVSSTRSFCMVLSSLYPSQARVYFRDRLDKWLIKDTPS